MVTIVPSGLDRFLVVQIGWINTSSIYNWNRYRVWVLFEQISYECALTTFAVGPRGLERVCTLDICPGCFNLSNETRNGFKKKKKPTQISPRTCRNRRRTPPMYNRNILRLSILAVMRKTNGTKIGSDHRGAPAAVIISVFKHTPFRVGFFFFPFFFYTRLGGREMGNV